MAAANFAPEIMTKIKEVTSMNYQEQAIFYLNAFWKDGADAEAETVWELVHAFIKEDHIKGKEGNELNPIQAFHVLQARNQTLTALELKAQLRKVDIDANGEMALCEYLLFINNRDPIKFITNPQGEIDPVQLKALEDKLSEVNAKFESLQVQLDAEKAAEAAAKSAEAEAIAKEDEAKAAAAKAKAAEDEVRRVEDEARAIAEQIKKEEDAKAANIARLEALSVDQTVGIVKRNMAVQELAAAKNEDSLPLRKAKLTQEAVVRKLAKVTAAAAEETAKANSAADVATEKRNDAAQKRKSAEDAALATQQAIKETQELLAAVEAELQALISSGDGNPQGMLWYQQRLLEDKKRSLPTRCW